MSEPVYPKRDEHDKQVLDRCVKYLEAQGKMGYVNYVQALRERIEKLEKEREAMGEVIHAVELLERTRGGMDLPFGFKDAQINKACVNLGQVFNHYLSLQSPAEGKETEGD